MEIIWIIIGSVLMIMGFVGSIAPVLPGLPISYAGLLLLQFTGGYPFSTSFLVIWGIIVAAIVLLDNLVAVWGTHKSGGSVYGIAGSVLGLLVGMVFFPPFGLIVGPLAGAFAGELLAGKSSDRAVKSALGSFVGFLLGTLMNGIASLVMAYYYFTNL